MRVLALSILLSVILALAPEVAHAQDVKRVKCHMIWNGAKLYEQLQHEDNKLAVAYLTGVVDALFVHDAMCQVSNYKGPWERPALPNRLSSHQAADIVLSYLKAHPGKGHEPAAGLVIHALQIAFPPERE